MLFTDVVITARVERRLVHGYERYFSMRKTCHESYLGFNRGSGITGYHEQSKSGERKKLEATDGFYFSGKTGQKIIFNSLPQGKIFILSACSKQRRFLESNRTGERKIL